MIAKNTIDQSLRESQLMKIDKIPPWGDPKLSCERFKIYFSLCSHKKMPTTFWKTVLSQAKPFSHLKQTCTELNIVKWRRKLRFIIIVLKLNVKDSIPELSKQFILSNPGIVISSDDLKFTIWGSAWEALLDLYYALETNYSWRPMSTVRVSIWFNVKLCHCMRYQFITVCQRCDVFIFGGKV